MTSGTCSDSQSIITKQHLSKCQVGKHYIPPRECKKLSCQALDPFSSAEVNPKDHANVAPSKQVTPSQVVSTNPSPPKKWVPFSQEEVLIKQVRELKKYVLRVKLQCGSTSGRTSGRTSGITSGSSTSGSTRSDLEVSSCLELLPHVGIQRIYMWWGGWWLS